MFIPKKKIEIKLSAEAIVPENWDKMTKQERLTFIKQHLDNGTIIKIINLK